MVLTKFETFSIRPNYERHKLEYLSFSSNLMGKEDELWIEMLIFIQIQNSYLFKFKIILRLHFVEREM